MTDDTEEPPRDRAVSYDHALDRSYQPRKGDLEKDVSVSVTPNRLAKAVRRRCCMSKAVPHGGTTEFDGDCNRIRDGGDGPGTDTLPNRSATRSRVIWALSHIIPLFFGLSV